MVVEQKIALAHRLDMKVIAKDVETNERRDLLLQAERDSAQGDLFEMPMPRAGFERFPGS